MRSGREAAIRSALGVTRRRHVVGRVIERVFRESRPMSDPAGDTGRRLARFSWIRSTACQKAGTGCRNFHREVAGSRSEISASGSFGLGRQPVAVVIRGVRRPPFQGRFVANCMARGRSPDMLEPEGSQRKTWSAGPRRSGGERRLVTLWRLSRASRTWHRKSAPKAHRRRRR
jgi:hypothetical protein